MRMIVIMLSASCTVRWVQAGWVGMQTEWLAGMAFGAPGLKERVGPLLRGSIQERQACVGGRGVSLRAVRKCANGQRAAFAMSR